MRGAVKEMTCQAGIVGRFTNHSLRATCATRMFENSVPEQIIKETTGHRLDCVQSYKRTSDRLKQKASETLSRAPMLSTINESDSDSPVIPTIEPEVETKPFQLSMDKMVQNVLKTKIELRKKLYPKS